MSLQSNRGNGLGQLKEKLAAIRQEEGEAQYIDASNNKPGNTISSPGTFEWPQIFLPHQRAIIGDAVKEARLAKHFTQSELERRCGFEHPLIGQIERGTTSKLEPALLKKIGFHLGNDFNEVVRDACDDTIKPREKEAIIALGPKLIEDEEKTYKIKADGFSLKCTISNHEFSLHQIESADGHPIEALIYRGRRSRDSLFIQALEKIITMVKKGM